jgi:DNA-binding response OmpR family regulator
MSDTKNKVLLLDDDKFLADMYAMKFVAAGYDVQACLSADDAIAVLKGDFAPHAVLFDIVMPGTDGFAFLQKMKDEHLAEHAIKIALTNQSDDAERKRATDLGADRYIVKASMIPSEVVNIVNEEIGKRKA